MQRYWLVATLVVMALAHSVSAETVGTVGVATIPVTVADGARELNVTLWYPADEGGHPVLVGDNAVFEGVEGRRDAPVAAGRFPLVLIAHGGLRSAPDLGGWIATRLAGRGFLAAQVQGQSLGPGDAARAVDEIARRPGDLSATLTALADSAWSDHVDPDRIAALGFFLGGTSVLALAGGRMDAEQFARTCAGDGQGVDCGWFEATGVDLRQVDVTGIAGSNRDPRIRAAIVVDPEYSGSFSAESLAGVAVPVKIVNLGGPDAVPPALDASGLRSAAPAIAYSSVPGATRFDAFSLCKPKGATILAEDGGDQAICHDDRESRLQMHADLARLVSEFLENNLKTAH